MWLILFSFFSIPLTILSQGKGITIDEITVPSPALTGQDLQLYCFFKLDKIPLYFLKWFKDELEFYKYIIEHDKPKIFTYNVPGVNIDLTRSYEGKVYLKNISLESAGVYKCKVSEDTPIFKTKQMQSKLIVYAAPTDSPFITGVKKSYGINETLEITCTSGPSYPAVKIKWFINELEMYGDQKTNSMMINSSAGQYVSTSQLVIRLGDSYFGQSHAISINCTAYIPGYYSDSTRIRILKKTAPFNSRTRIQGHKSTSENKDNIEKPQLHTNNSQACVINFNVLFILIAVLTAKSNFENSMNTT